jgi:hypothetical protein
MTRGGVNPFLDKIIKISSENISFCLGESEVGPDAFALAALVHAAPGRVSGTPVFANMRRELLLCAKKLSSGSAEESELVVLAEQRLAVARAAYRKRGPFWDVLRFLKRSFSSK